MGPTASGKTALAEDLAGRFGAQLINADAFQVYRGMDIGTGKSERRELYALLDLADPDQDFGLGEWIRLAAAELDRIWSEGQSAIVVGGTGLYLRALMEEYAEMAGRPSDEIRSELMALEKQFGLQHLADRLRAVDPAVADGIDLKNPVRVRRALEKVLSPPAKVSFALPPFRKLKVGLNPPPEDLERRITVRVHQMFESGWEKEVAGLLDLGYSEQSPGFRAIGYRQVAALVRGEFCESEAKSAVELASRQYAKRQRTWMRKEPSLLKVESSTEVEQLIIGT